MEAEHIRKLKQNEIDSWQIFIFLLQLFFEM